MFSERVVPHKNLEFSNVFNTLLVHVHSILCVNETKKNLNFSLRNMKVFHLLNQLILSEDWYLLLCANVVFLR